MTFARGRIIRQGQEMTCLPMGRCHASNRIQGQHIIYRERWEAAQQANQLVASAQEQAKQIERQAREQSEMIYRSAFQRGLQEGEAKLATAWLRVHEAEAKADEAALHRSITIGKLLAERLIGEALRIDPECIATLAREAVHQLWRSRQVRIFAHPDDIAGLQRHIATFGMPPERITLRPDPSRRRGCLRFQSELGELDADLELQLDRLAEAIRQELGAD